MGNLRGSRGQAPAQSYLRGSRSTIVKVGGPPTLQNQIDSLKIKVGKNKPEKQFRQGTPGVMTSTGIAPEYFDFDISNDLVTASSPAFRDMVLGDRWTNYYLKLNTILDFNESPMFRVMVYYAADPGTFFHPNALTVPSDPAAFHVLYEERFNPDVSGERKAVSRHISLRGLRTVYNGSSALWERGRLILMVQCHPNTSGNIQAYYQTLLCFANK